MRSCWPASWHGRDVMMADSLLDFDNIFRWCPRINRGREDVRCDPSSRL